MQISTELAIPGRADEVWAVLIYLPSYPQWNPFIRRVGGSLAEGVAWKAELTIDGRLFFSVPTVITKLMSGARLTWRGGLPKLMIGTHSFGVTEASGVVTLQQSEKFSGPLVPVVFPLLKPSLIRRLTEMNEALMSEVVRRKASERECGFEGSTDTAVLERRRPQHIVRNDDRAQ
ncbi:SRPBCC domain-containing protein [Methylobacterium sp. WL64]|uniref:SRPBCC domain-containing protein n=1 Tax=Methylobacterium sp. WL64 TaxID=2603894 RepID=UPI0011CA4612|nr:SRPBCC domain-containing protein [Methylobacterium sp. WL64]TXM97543.1 SRPBCC domain-containing protein [Methylobacterium sp. WL64]